MQLTIPSEPARAVSTAMRILRICFQSGFIVIYNFDDLLFNVSSI